MTQEAIALFGTTETEPVPRSLRAGQLAAVFDGTGLRWISWRGVELVRAITFLVRDDSWRTPAASVSDLEIDEQAGRFSVRFTSQVEVGGSVLRSNVAYEGDEAGRLSARVRVEALTDFRTNRTGFVVLHPLEGVAGAPVEVEHVDGSRETVTLGATINPAQPLKDIRALAHEAAPGLRAVVRMEGDTFEMEDQRNWTDASFKTYSRPLSLPFPYSLARGDTVEQSVTLAVEENEHRATSGPGRTPDGIVIGEAAGETAPRIGLALEAGSAREALGAADLVREAHPSFLFVLLDPTQGHGAAELAAVQQVAAATGLPVSLHVVVPGREEPPAELGRIARQLEEAGIAPESIAVFPKVDETSFQPGQPRPPAPTLESLYQAARAAFPGARLGGGSPAFFPELNRKRPPAQLLDFVTTGGCATVHQADDASVMETLEAWPWIVRSMRAFIGHAQCHIGPANIGARLNPYGAGPADNPGNGRVPLARMDPRQRGVFGAAWHAGLAATLAPFGIPDLVVGAPTGPFGIAHAPQPWPQPGFDAGEGGAVFPLWHVVADLGEAAGRRLRQAQAAPGLAALAWEGAGGPSMLVANLTAQPRTVRVEGAGSRFRGRVLDVASFDEATRQPRAFRDRRDPLSAGGLDLGPYAVARLDAEA